MSEKDGLIAVDDMTEEELKGFSEDELAALRGEDEESYGDEEETAVVEEAPVTEAVEEEVEEVEETAEAETEETEEEVAVEATEDTTEEAEPAEEPTVTEEVAPVPEVQYQYAEPEEAVKEIDASKVEMATLLADYRDGEIDVEQYETKRFEIVSKINEINIGINNSKLMAEMNHQQEVQRWNMEQASFFAENPDFKLNTVKYNALNSAVQAVANEEKWAGKSGSAILNEAKRQIDEAFGTTPKPKRKAKAAKKIPQTLGTIPAADENSTTDQGKFSYLDNLEGEALEQAYMKLSDADRNTYLSTM